MTSTFQARIDAGLVEDPGECVHGWPAGDCPHCENDDLKNDLLAASEQAVELEAAYSELKDAILWERECREVFAWLNNTMANVRADLEIHHSALAASKAVEDLICKSSS